MQIDSIEVFHVALPYRQPQATPWGAAEKLETVLVRIAGGGAAGWGEASPGNAPVAGPDWAAGTFQCIRDWLVPRLVGCDIDSGDKLQDRMAPFRGNRFAKAAVDTAWWDLQARLAGQPLHRLLDGDKEAVEVGVGFDRMDSPDEFLAAIGRAVEAGFGRVELKFRPGWDVQMVSAVRREFPLHRFHIDVEGGLTSAHAEILYRLDDFCLAMVEQPLAADDLVGHAMLHEGIRTPISLDESITTPEQAEIALDLHSGQFVNLKPGRVGGLTPAVAIHDACHRACVACWVGAMPQSALGARIGYALAATSTCSYPADYFPSSDLLAADLAPPLLPSRSASDAALAIPLWSEPGLGIEPDAGALAAHTVAKSA
jgi:O-succinylbenzoate synthase